MYFSLFGGYHYKHVYLGLSVLGITIILQYSAMKLSRVVQNQVYSANRETFLARPAVRRLDQSGCQIHNFSSTLLSHSSDRIQCVPTHTSPPVTVCIYPPSMDVYISMSLVHRGHWEGHITRQIVEQMLQHPHAGFLDLGANLGVHGLVVAKLQRSVVAVEPFVQNIKRIHKSVNLNQLKSYILVQNAVSDYRGEAILDIGWRNIGGSTIERGFSKNYNRKQVVSTIYMDDLLDVMTFTDVVVKIDIEGSEPRAFLKAYKFFERLKIVAIFMEWGQIRKLAPMSEENTQNIIKMTRLFVTHNLVPHTLQNTSGGSHQLNISNWMTWPHDLVWLSKDNPSSAPRL